jgi:hypothetical protein
MWKNTLIINVLIMFAFWLAGFIAISPAFNHFVQYPNTAEELQLPILTKTVCSLRLTSLLVPVIWLLVSVFFIIQLKKKNVTERIECIQLHTSISTLAGLIIFIIFAIGGILPFLRISGFIQS